MRTLGLFPRKWKLNMNDVLNLNKMVKAMRLTRAGRLTEATRSFASATYPASRNPLRPKAAAGGHQCTDFRRLPHFASFTATTKVRPVRAEARP